MNKRKIKDLLKYNKLTGGLYATALKIRDNKQYHNKFDYHGTFFDRKQGKEYLCIILAGYKEFLYPTFFERIEKCCEANIDICVVSSGVYSEKLKSICERNNWSYLSTKENNVALIQNVAIQLHPDAKYIFKIDEDIFITKNFFSNMIRAYNHAGEGDYEPGIVAPLIPINGYGNVRILDMLGLREIFEKKFEKPKHMAGVHRMVESNPEVAKFFWGEGGYVPKIDDMNEMAVNRQLEERPCSIKFSIGAILFARKLWTDMGYFNVDRSGNAMGVDEIQITEFCLSSSRPIMVSENVVVGHLSFGTQNEIMKQYYMMNPDKFKL